MAYYKEECTEGVVTSPPAGVIPLKDAIVFPTIWAPEGMFGWMIVTAGGVKYLFRTFGYKDREAWLKKVNELACVRVSSAQEQEKLNKQETTTGFMGSLFRRSTLGSSVHGMGAAAQSAAPAAADDDATLGKREVRYFLKECGLTNLATRFVGNGIDSFEKLADLVTGSSIEVSKLSKMSRNDTPFLLTPFVARIRSCISPRRRRTPAS